jgi:hypothetical protein
MKKNLSNVLIALLLFFVPKTSSGQIITLGTASEFVIFTTVGAVTNSGTNFETRLTGKVGSNSGSSTGFGNVDGTMHSGDPITIAAGANLITAYNQLNLAAPTAFPSSSLGNGATFAPGVYSIPTAATLTGNLTFDGLGNPGSVFIIKIGGALTGAANAKVILTNGALACNVYWKTEGLTSFGAGSTIRGTVVANNAAIAMGTLDTLEGRLLSLNGAITLNSLTGATPIGCGSPTLNGPVAPTFGAVNDYAIFSSIGPVTNSGGTSYITGDIGTNLGLTTGYNPLFVNGTIHPVPDGSTAAAAPALTVAYNQLNALPNDIILLFPAIFGHNLVLTPHTYILNAATTLTDTLYLNAQGNSNAVFVIKVNGALNTISGATIKLMNGTQSKNVYWMVEGAVNLATSSVFHGNIVANNGAIDITPGTKLYGRAYTTTGAITTSGDSITAPLLPTTGTIVGDSTVCVGASAPYTGVDPGGSWSVTNARATIANTGILTGVSAGLDTIIYTVTNGFGTATTTKVVNVKPLPNAGTISGPSSVCVASSIVLTSSAPGGIWTASNATATVVNGLVTGIAAGIDTIRYTVANSCGIDTATKIINIYDVATVNTPANQVVCNASPTATVTFTGLVPGTLYSWTNNNTTIGLAASGNGNIVSFTATNGTATAVTATITVTPSANGCTGASKNFTITVNPTPTVNTISNQTLCNTAPTAAVNFAGTVTGTVYTWTNNNTSIGLPASGNGNIASFTAMNSSNAPVVATVTVIPSANGCTGSSKNFSYTVNPTPTVTVSNQVVCNNAPTTAVNYSGTVSGTSFAWTNNTTSIGLAASGNGNIPSFTAQNSTSTPVVATVTVTPSANGCTGTVNSFTITVNPTPNVAVFNQVVCNNAPTTAVNYSGTVSGTSFAWTNNNTSIGLAGSGNGNIASFTALNSTSAPVVATVTVTPSANGCTGTVNSFTITVNPTPNVAVSNQVVCNNAPTTAVNYTGTVSGTSFFWTNNNTTIGLAASGNGNIPSFTALNTTSAPEVATITVTPSANGCTGTVNSFTITVNPTPNVGAIPDQVLCNGAPTNAVNYSGSVSGTSFAWTNNNTSIGLAAAGNGPIFSFIALNNTSSPSIATIKVTPMANSCLGSIDSFTITVNPTPNVAVVANQDVCNGLPTANINYTGTVSGTAFAWTNNNTSIGLAASGTGNIASFIALNTTNTPVVASISVTPSANGCIGLTRSFTITVNPTPVAPVISLTTPASVCDLTYYRNFGAATLPPTGMKYTWSTVNAGISDTGSTTQYVLVNFKTPGTATVILTGTVVNTGCLNASTYNVEVTTNKADVPAEVIYFNKSFVCLQNNEEAYAWGYDDANTLAPTSITGEMNQDYVNATPDLANNRYWAMVSHNGCIQKTYYNKPEGAVMKTMNGITVFPNPANHQIQIDVNTAVKGDIQMEIYNMLGHKMYTTNSTNNSTTVDISNFPAGVYMVICYRNNEKTTARFIKN